MYLTTLGQEWLPAIGDVHRRLMDNPPARVADIGCGVGWSAIGMAQAYPAIRVDGFDIDEPSIEASWRHARQYGLTDRVTFHTRDVCDGLLNGRYDLVTAFDCIHEMHNPVDALATMGRLASNSGSVIVMDSRVGDRFTASGNETTSRNEVESLMYGQSVLHGLPVGMGQGRSAATGAVMRTNTLRCYAIEAGFRHVEVLPIQACFFQFYRLSF